MHVLHVVGARPNFMKVAPVMAALGSRESIRQTLVHTGQHYDASMSDVFFQQLEIREPDANLEVGPGTHAVQTAEIMSRFEPVVLGQKPDLVLVYGDVNSTIATAIVCAKLLIPVGHVEAGLRSFDSRMPEEINRVLTDRIASLLFTPSSDGDENLLREGINANRIHLVGNVMIDTLVRLLPRTNPEAVIHKLLLSTKLRYALVTLHRPSNVDDPGSLREIMHALNKIAENLDIIFPVHPRTHRVLRGLDIGDYSPRLHLIEPLGYLEFLSLQRRAAFVVTDSGGIQEETTFLGVPCLTMRENTERPVTITVGTNILIGQDMAKLKSEAARIFSGEHKRGASPPLWDGKASQRIADVILEGNLHP